MGHVNLCLKGLFVGFNTLFGIIGILLIVLGKTASTMATGEGRSDMWQICLLGGAIAAISCLGVFGATQQMTCALKMFSGFVCIGMVICVIAGLSLANNRSMITEEVQELVKEEDIKKGLKDVQAEYKLECCGIDKDYTDWGPEIPDSCVCAPVHQGTATCYQDKTLMSKQVEVYKEPCVVYLLRLMDKAIDIAIWICFGFALVALIGMIMALVMVAQINSVNEDHRGHPHHALQRSAFV